MAASNQPLIGETIDRETHRKGHSVRHWLLFLLVTLASGFLIFKYAWLPRREQNREISQEAKSRTHAHPVAAVVKIDAVPFSRELSIPGTALAFTEASIYARSSGY